MKQYQIITLIVICLTVFTVYQIQRGLLQKTHNFLVESVERLPEGPSLLPASSEATLPAVGKELSQPEPVEEQVVVMEEIDKINKGAEAKVVQKKLCSEAARENKAQVRNSSEAKINSRVLVRENNRISGSGCMGFIFY